MIRRDMQYLHRSRMSSSYVSTISSNYIISCHGNVGKSN
nr:MAG TPA: hypothetical protein [Caudoviricetes sp.]